MNRIICLAVFVVLLAVWLMPAVAESGEEADPITVGPCNGETIYVTDLDGDGKDEEIFLKWIMSQYDMENACLVVRASDGTEVGYPTDIVADAFYYVIDADPEDGRQEIIVSGDVMSFDYCTWILRYENGNLVLLPYQTEDAEEYMTGVLSGAFVRWDDGKIIIRDNVDVLGTWWGDMPYQLNADKTAIEAVPGAVWTFEYDFEAPETWERCLELKKDLTYTDLSGAEATLLAGSRLQITETDAAAYVVFRAEDGTEGRFEIAPAEEGWGWMIAGVNEAEWFVELPYAG